MLQRRERKGTYIRAATLKARYGITIADYQRMMGEQGEKCAVCRLPHNKPLYVDHCHKTGAVRGLLCPACNTLVGFIENHPDRIDAARKFLLKDQQP